ncbi:MAG: hypothetical protein LBR07_06985, partial [Puniceicoccales bacterium]|nr:hypothetical protein [Puniceicoccales bacterium]
MKHRHSLRNFATTRAGAPADNAGSNAGGAPRRIGRASRRWLAAAAALAGGALLAAPALTPEQLGSGGGLFAPRARGATVYWSGPSSPFNPNWFANKTGTDGVTPTAINWATTADGRKVDPLDPNKTVSSALTGTGATATGAFGADVRAVFNAIQNSSFATATLDLGTGTDGSIIPVVQLDALEFQGGSAQALGTVTLTGAPVRFSLGVDASISEVSAKALYDAILAADGDLTAYGVTTAAETLRTTAADILFNSRTANESYPTGVTLKFDSVVRFDNNANSAASAGFANADLATASTAAAQTAYNAAYSAWTVAGSAATGAEHDAYVKAKAALEVAKVVNASNVFTVSNYTNAGGAISFAGGIAGGSNITVQVHVGVSGVPDTTQTAVVEFASGSAKTIVKDGVGILGFSSTGTDKITLAATAADPLGVSSALFREVNLDEGKLRLTAAATNGVFENDTVIRLASDNAVALL